MTVRAVEGKKPYTGGIAIEVTEDKVINLRLRDENNLIIWDEGDNEIYVDLQLPDGIKPTDAFPVGITTGRVLVADDWDVTGTIICAKTTSGDNIKVLYGDDNKLYVDNGTGLFKEVAFKSDVDLAIQTLRAYIDQQLALKQDKLTAGNNITIDQNNVISAMLSASSRFLSLWDCETGLPISFPGTIPFEYETGDHFLVENVGTTNYRPDGLEYDGTASTTVETEDVAIGDMYYFDGASWLLQQNHDPEVSFSQIAGQPTDNTNLATALNGKQDTLTAGANITIDANNEISATDTTYTAGTNVQISNQNVISSTDTTYTAGSGIDIDANDEISIDTTVVATQTDLSNGLANKQDTLTAGIGISIANDTIDADDIVVPMPSLGEGWRDSGLILASSGVGKGITIRNNGDYYKVWKVVDNLPTEYTIYASNGDTDSGGTLGYIISGDISNGITSIVSYTNEYFKPGAGTTGQILRKTANGYEWSNESGAVTLDADDIDDTNTTNKFVTTAEKNTWDGKQDALTGGSNGDVLTNVNGTPTWQQPSGGDVMVSTQTGNQFTPGMKIWGGTSSDLGNLTQDLNTLYMAY